MKKIRMDNDAMEATRHASENGVEFDIHVENSGNMAENIPSISYGGVVDGRVESLEEKKDLVEKMRNLWRKSKN